MGAHAADANEVLSINELHRRMVHVSHERAKLLVKKGLVEGVTLEDNSEVVICESAVGDEVHSDLWGPAPVESINHKRYYVSFTDDYSRYSNVYFLHTKDETFNAYQTYEGWLSNQHNARIKSLRTDRGGEYRT